MPQRTAVERLARPATAPLPQPQAGHPRHEVQLTGPNVTQRERVQPDTVRPQVHVALVDALRGAVEAPGLDADPSWADGAGLDVLVDTVPVAPQRIHQVRHHVLHHEHAVVSQMLRSIHDAADLLVLRHQVHDRVEDDEDQPVPARQPHLGHIALHDVQLLPSGPTT